ncbi:MAG TPA: hypothetical protein VLL94_13340 [Nitrospiraceae bacterium]|nr:hypothetical protein [Nitrospiraceae bacterium]
MMNNGFADTSMVGFGGQLTDDEVPALIQSLRNLYDTSPSWRRVA